jgi:type IV pilus assembly protein PilC
MQIFIYTAKDTKNITRTGAIEAPDEKSAAQTLRQHGLVPIDLKRKQEKVGPLPIGRLQRIGYGELVNFTRQLSTMINAGLTLPEALSLLEKQVANRKLKKIIGDVLREVEGGNPLSKALSSYPAVFSNIYVSLVKAGEQAGVLDNVLGRLADNLEKEREFRSKTRGALIYPAIIVIAMVGVIFVMLIFVIPRLTDLYKEFGTSLPLPTRILIALSNFMVAFWWLVIGLLVAGSVFWQRWTRQGVGKKFRDEMMLKLPVWGKMKQNTILTEFSRTLALLIGAGIPIIEALKSVAAALDNVIYSDSLLEAAAGVEKGFPLGMSLSHSKVFPPIIFQMIKTGEETGKLDDVLSRVSRYFEMEAEQGVKNLTTAMEPIILIMLAFGVAFLIISVILPIYNLTSQF